MQNDAAAGTERRSRRRPGENRERLLGAGILEFGRLGYRGASTTAIAAIAKVPQPHVYTNFRTKQELFLGCVTRAVEELLLPAAPSSSPGERDALSRIVLQAVSALGEESLHGELGAMLSGLREALGGDAFEALLVRGARSLIG